MSGNLHFNFNQLMVMRFINVFPLSYERIRNSKHLNFLLYYSLIEYSDKNHTKCTLNHKGRMTLTSHRHSLIKFWIPVVISSLALLASYDAYTIPILKKILQQLAQLLKSI